MIVKIRIDNVRKILIRRGVHYNHASYLAERTGLSISFWYKVLQGHLEAGGLARERLHKCFCNVRWDDIFLIEEDK